MTPAAFGTACGALTLGCDQCHMPSPDPFADQDFSAPQG